MQSVTDTVSISNLQEGGFIPSHFGTSYKLVYSYYYNILTNNSFSLRAGSLLSMFLDINSKSKVKTTANTKFCIQEYFKFLRAEDKTAIRKDSVKHGVVMISNLNSLIDVNQLHRNEISVNVGFELTKQMEKYSSMLHTQEFQILVNALGLNGTIDFLVLLSKKMGLEPK